MASAKGKEPLISAIVVNYNAGRLLTQCIEQVLASTVKVELIMVDNNSTDGSLNSIEHAFSHESRIQIIKNQRNLGFAKAVNIGLGNSQSDVILLLNPDCIIEVTTLEHLLRTLSKEPDIGMVGPIILNADGTEQAGCRRDIPTPWRSLARAFGLSRWSFSKRGPLRDFSLHQAPVPTGPLDVDAISGAFMLIRRAALNDVGPLDEGYFMHCEDLDWCIRFRERGWRVVFVPDVSVTHHKGACSKDRPIRVLWHMHRGMMRFYRKFFRHQYPIALLWLVAVGVWLRFSILAFYHLVRQGIGAGRAR